MGEDKEFFDRQQIIARGIISNIGRTLGGADRIDPVNHWLNYTGKQMFEKSRVEIAEQLASKRTNDGYSHPDAKDLNEDYRAVTPAIIAIGYQRLLRKVDISLARDISGQRITHPVIGRQPGSAEKEVPLIRQALCKIADYAYPIQSFRTMNELEATLVELSQDAAKRLGHPWPEVIIRRQDVSEGVSRATSRPSAREFLDVLSLIYAGKIRENRIRISSSRDETDIAVLFSNSPMLRFDHIIR